MSRPMTKPDEDGFLERWSRRKRGDAADGDLGTEAAAAEAPLLSESGTAESGTAESDAGDPEVIAKLPDLDSLTEDTDFTAFFQDGVPEAIRRQALRKLWRLNPVFANLDGLNDYDEDYSALGIIAENIKTMYKVGKGYLDDEEDKDEEDKDEDETGDEDEIAENEPGDVEAVTESETPDAGDLLESAEVSEIVPESVSESPTGRDVESESERPVSGSALARRWGGILDKG